MTCNIYLVYYHSYCRTVFLFCSSGMEILISASDCHKLTQESKELLCAACEMAQLRCAKLINVRGKVSWCYQSVR